MKKKNLIETAESLLEGAAENLQASINASRPNEEQFGLNRPDLLPNQQVYTGESPSTNAQELPNYLVGVPKANYPGTPPQLPPDQFGQGRVDNTIQGQPLQTQVGRTDAAQSSVFSQQPKFDNSQYTVNAPLASQFPQTLVNNPASVQYPTPGQMPLQYNVNEDIDAIFSGETLSEEFKNKAKLIFESAVNARVKDLVDYRVSEIEDKLVEEFESTIEETKAQLEEKVSEYIDYFTTEWLKENELAVESGIKSEITESFMEALKAVFVEHYIDIPENKIDLVEELTEKIENLENSLNEEYNKNIILSKQLNESKKDAIIDEMTKDLTLTQSEKIKSISENVDFNSELDFRNKLKTIRESYYPSSVNVSSPSISNKLEEAIITESDNNAGKAHDIPEIGLYLKTLKRFSKK